MSSTDRITVRLGLNDVPNKCASKTVPSKSKLEEQFIRFAKFGRWYGDKMTASNLEKWLVQSNAVQPKHCAEVTIAFTEVSKKRKSLGWEEILQVLALLSKRIQISTEEMHERLSNCETPVTNNTTAPCRSRVIGRLTDPNLYTGTQKKNFDVQCGRIPQRI